MTIVPTAAKYCLSFGHLQSQVSYYSYEPCLPASSQNKVLKRFTAFRLIWHFSGNFTYEQVSQRNVNVQPCSASVSVCFLVREGHVLIIVAGLWFRFDAALHQNGMQGDRHGICLDMPLCNVRQSLGACVRACQFVSVFANVPLILVWGKGAEVTLHPHPLSATIMRYF